MKRAYPILILLIAVVIASMAGVLYVLRPPAEASGPLEAIPLEISGTENDIAADGTSNGVKAVPTAVVVDPADTAAEVEIEGSSGPVIYQISSAGSQVRFELDEDLRGVRTTVVGATNQVAGQFAIDMNNLTQTQVGVIQINARTLSTDNSNRNRAMQNEILDTGSYEFIIFTPTAVTGLPSSAGVGDTFNFTIEGNLTIRNITLPVVFSVQATAVSESQITGTASTLINRGDYDLTIPNVPSVANVEEEVELYIDFTAEAIE
jgi:polyisoprenoid-binding protein YceI